MLQIFLLLIFSKYCTKDEVLSVYANTTHDFISSSLPVNNLLTNPVKICLFYGFNSSIFPTIKTALNWHKNALYKKAVISSELVSSLHNKFVWAIGGFPVKKWFQFNICSSINFWTSPALSSSNKYEYKPLKLYSSFKIFCL